MEKRCCICGKTFIEYANNASPIKNGICCNDCNSKFVIPARFVHGICSYEIVKNPKEWKTIKTKITERDFEQIDRNKDCSMYIFQHPGTGEKIVVCVIV